MEEFELVPGIRMSYQATIAMAGSGAEMGRDSTQVQLRVFEKLAAIGAI